MKAPLTQTSVDIIICWRSPTARFERFAIKVEIREFRCRKARRFGDRDRLFEAVNNVLEQTCATASGGPADVGPTSGDADSSTCRSPGPYHEHLERLVERFVCTKVPRVIGSAAEMGLGLAIRP